MRQLASLQPTWPSPCGHLRRTLITWPAGPDDLRNSDALLDGQPVHVIEAVSINDAGPHTVGITVS